MSIKKPLAHTDDVRLQESLRLAQQEFAERIDWLRKKFQHVLRPNCTGAKNADRA
jgi:hypothetical protein